MTTTPDAPTKTPTGQLEELLHAHYIRPEDRQSPAGAGAVYLTEVTAPGSNRRADVVHVGLWQNRGAGRIDVCELKTSRGDFLRELKDPAKAEAWWPYSTTFNLVVPHLSIAGPDDLPPGWGLLIPTGRGRRFKEVVKPAERTPQLTIGLLLTLLKNTETTRTNALREQHGRLTQEFYRREEKLRRELASSSDPETSARLQLLDKLEVRLGMRLKDYAWRDEATSPEVAAAALKDLAAGHAAVARAKSDLRMRAEELDRAAVDIAQHAASLRAALGEPAGRNRAANHLATQEA